MQTKSRGVPGVCDECNVEKCVMSQWHVVHVDPGVNLSI